MLPLVDPTVLSQNPNFNALYSDLLNNKLNADGTSKLDAKAQRDRDALTEDLRKARVEAAKRDLIKSELQSLAYRPDELPEDLQQLVAVVAALLDGQIAEEDKYLLRDDLAKLANNIEQINAALGKKVQKDANALASMLDPDISVAIKDIPTFVSKLKGSVPASETLLSQHRLSLAHEAVKLHDLYQKVIERSINILEQVIHGSVARGAKAKADYLALVAEGMEKKLKIQYAQLLSQSLHSAEVQEAFEVKLKDMEADTRSMRRRVTEAEGQLEEYRMIGGMEKLANEYARILEETEKVKSDINRLEG